MKSQVPKVLHRICGRELVGLVVDSAKQAGLDSIVVVVPPDSQSITDSLGNGVTYAVQSEPLGSGHALLQARPILADVEHVLVLSGDVPLIHHETMSNLVRLHVESEAGITLLTSTPSNPDGLGRVVRSSTGDITAIVEEADADEAILEIAEVNSGAYCFRAAWLMENLGNLSPSSRGEIFLTDIFAVACEQGVKIESMQSQDPHETLGVNTRVQLAEAEAVLRRRVLQRWMLHGVTMPDPASVYIDVTANLGQDTVVLPNTHITGGSRIGVRCQIGPNSIVRDSTVGDGSTINSSVVECAILDSGVDVGPFSHIRPGSHLESGVHIGNFAEVKNSRLGAGTKSGHFSYIGDADLGANVNVGAGTVTCNYDGDEKHRTIIGADAFIGSDSMLVAPINIGARASTGAGSVVTKDVPPDSIALGAPARVLPKKKRPHQPP